MNKKLAEKLGIGADSAQDALDIIKKRAEKLGVGADPAQDALDIIAARMKPFPEPRPIIMSVTPIAAPPPVFSAEHHSVVVIDTRDCKVIREQDENVCSSCGRRWDVREEKPDCN